MNKFSKTAYPRHISQNILANPTCHKKQKKNNQDQSKHVNDQNPLSLQSLVQKKIEIDPTLLFSAKTNSRGAKINNQNQKRNYSINTQQCENTIKEKNNQERPKSKQQSRVKAVESSSLQKKSQNNNVRPHTSKGLRSVIYHRQFKNKSLADQSQNQVQIKREAKTATGFRKRHTSRQIQLQTSIDPQFLSLFAS